MGQFLLRLIINSIALWVTALIVPGIRLEGGDAISFVNLLIVALIFGLVNSILKPILMLLTCPFYILTLGLFTFVINAGLLMLTSWLVGPRFMVDGFGWALLGSVLISLISIVLSSVFRENEE